MSFPIDDDGIERFRIGNKTLVYCFNFNSDC
ncbi:Uncharacterised protein [Vibrio cholerae]|nr:Uncharacterised protein [Vibrio cholerae]